MSFELDTRGADEVDERAKAEGVPLGSGIEPGVFSGTGTATVKGLARGLVAKPALLLGDAATPLLRSSARAADKALGTDLDKWLVDQQKRNVQALDDLKPDPLTTGFAGQLVGGLFDLGGSALLYTPEGAAVMEGYARRQELISAGVDAGTATAGGAISGVATYAGVKAPVTLGQASVGQGAAAVGRNVVYGATVSATTGITERNASRDLLKRSGYPEQAAAIEPYDRAAIAAELVLGGLFSGGAAALSARQSVQAQHSIDAARAVGTAHHAQFGTAPGVPADVRSTGAHGNAMAVALQQALHNEPVNVGDALADTTFVRPVSEAAAAARAELQAHVADLLPEPAQTPTSNIQQVVEHLESRGRRFGKDGQILEGPPTKYGTAKGEMQVVDSTNLNPGYGVRPAKDGSAEERARVGRDFITALQKHYGNDEMALAAYNWGPGNLDKALAQAKRSGGDWHALLPAETSRYVADGAGMLRRGRTGEVVTERGMRVPFRYRVAEADHLITSNDADLRPNPAYPADLQPRDRTRDASEAQIARIAGNLQPELLAESVRASDGAPIVGPDGVVESGNGRLLALGRAYGGERGAEYRTWLEGNADRFGVEAGDVRSMRRPVLVRERTGDVDRAEFARQANESSVAAMSPTEQARADAARIADMSGLVTAEDGTINQAQSAGFLRQFVQANVGPNERESVLQADGRISQAGLQRVRQAVFAKAYGDPDLVAMLTESTDSNVRNVLTGLMRAAPAVARLEDLASAGARRPVELGASLARAAREFASLRAQGRTVDEALDQLGLFDGMSPDMQALVRGIAERANAPKRLAEMVGRLVDAVDALGDPRQRDILDAPDLAAAAGKADSSATPMRQAVEGLAARMEGKQPGQVIQELKQEGKLTPMANNAVVALAETGGDPRRINALIAHADALAREAPGRPEADILADAVERTRSGAPLPEGEADTGAATRSADPAVLAAAQAAAATPDLRVVLEDGTELSAREVMARSAAERQIAEQDSAAFDAAVSCFLRT